MVRNREACGRTYDVRASEVAASQTAFAMGVKFHDSTEDCLLMHALFQH